MLPAKQEQRSLTRRTRGAIQSTAEVVVPTVLVGAGYLVAGGHWEAFKTLLAGWGIPVGTTVFLAPVVAVLAALGVRQVVRMVGEVRQAGRVDTDDRIREE